MINLLQRQNEYSEIHRVLLCSLGFNLKDVLIHHLSHKVLYDIVKLGYAKYNEQSYFGKMEVLR